MSVSVLPELLVKLRILDEVYSYRRLVCAQKLASDLEMIIVQVLWNFRRPYASFVGIWFLSVSWFVYVLRLLRGPLMVAQWLRYCATNWKVAGSIPGGVIGIFHWHNPSDRTMALGST
jgi:hypothetical protein